MSPVWIDEQSYIICGNKPIVFEQMKCNWNISRDTPDAVFQQRCVMTTLMNLDRVECCSQHTDHAANSPSRVTSMTAAFDRAKRLL